MREEIIIFAFFLGVVNPISVDVCHTPGCKDAVSEIIRSMDPKVEPCDDFYNFACGNFIKTTVIPKGKVRVDRFDLLNYKTKEQLRTVIEEKIQLNEPKFSKLAKNYYKSCIDTAAIEKKGLQPILDILKTLGGWPVLNKTSSNNEKFDWIKTTSNLFKLGFQADYLFMFDINTGVDKNSTKYSIYQPELGLDRKHLLKGFSDKLVNVYNRYMVDIAVIFGADRSTAEKEMKESLEFEIELAKISLPEEKYNDPSVKQPMKVKELSKKYPNIPWKEYFNAMLEGVMTIGDEEVIVVYTPSFFKEFEKLIKQTSKTILANYLLRRSVDQVIHYLPEKVRKRQIQFFSAIIGEFENQPRWKGCLDEVSALLDISATALYVRRYLTKDTKKSAADLVAAIKKESTKILRETDWMDEKTRKSALEKIDAIAETVGYPDELIDDKKVDDFYNNLEITPNDYFGAGLNTTHFMIGAFKSDFENPSVQTLDSIDHSDSFIVNVSYTAYDNRIDITAAALQDFLFNKDRPMVMNFAALGGFIASAIAASFHGDGKQYDKNEKFVDWWQPETKKKYNQKTKCFVQQYNKYTVKELGLNVNGKKTKEENVADNEGLRTSYLAYQDWVKQQGVQPKFPELQQYSQTKIFWIAAAQSLCTKYTKEGLQGIMRTTQSPTEFRILGSFSNMPEFAKDFNCPAGSNMNPVKKCAVW